MPDKQPPRATETPTFEHERDATLRSLYVNSVEVLPSFFDVKITLSEVQRVEGSKVYVLDHAIIHMSVEHARSMQLLLAAQLDAYEERFGEIRTAPNESK